MAIAFVQGTSNSASATSVSVTLNVTAGNLIVLNVIAGGFSNYNSGVSDTAGNTYTDTLTYSVGTGYSRIWRTVANSTGSITITGTGSAVGFRILIAQEFSGFTNPVVDKTATSLNQSSSPLGSGTTATTTANDELVIGCFHWTTTGAGTGATAGSGYSNLTYTNNASSTTQQGAMESKIVSATGTQTATIDSTNTTISGSSAGGAIITFKEQGATYNIVVNQGSYSLSGQDINFRRNYVLAIEQGAYALAGQSINLIRQFTMAIASGIYSLVGNAIRFRYTGWVQASRPDTTWSQESRPDTTWNQDSRPSTTWNKTSR